MEKPWLMEDATAAWEGEGGAAGPWFGTDVRRVVEINAHPLALRQDVVSVGPACGHQAIPDGLRDRNIYEAVGMHMTDLASREAILRSTGSYAGGWPPPGQSCTARWILSRVPFANIPSA
jgi:hypothetical protein